MLYRAVSALRSVTHPPRGFYSSCQWMVSSHLTLSLYPQATFHRAFTASGTAGLLYDVITDPRGTQDWGVPAPESAPGSLDLGTLVSGTLVKVCHRSENFWVRVTHSASAGAGEPAFVEGVVSAFLVQSHPFKLGDTIRFPKQNIYAVVRGNSLQLLTDEDAPPRPQPHAHPSMKLCLIFVALMSILWQLHTSSVCSSNTRSIDRKLKSVACIFLSSTKRRGSDLNIRLVTFYCLFHS
jgi:hypothetical protein